MAVVLDVWLLAVWLIPVCVVALASLLTRQPELGWVSAIVRRFIPADPGSKGPSMLVTVGTLLASALCYGAAYKLFFELGAGGTPGKYTVGLGRRPPNLRWRRFWIALGFSLLSVFIARVAMILLTA